jgi:ectoine hydroxylase-related dioxygenase (phytanoyl-CoA dioxygenase family)
MDDLPPASGGFTVWPGSHIRIWKDHWQTFNETGETHAGRRERVRRAGGYESLPEPIFEEIKSDTHPVDTHGPAGTVVLWHTKLLHMPGQNTSEDVIRQATIYGYIKTQAALPDALAMDNTTGNIWRDWSDEVQAITD